MRGSVVCDLCAPFRVPNKLSNLHKKGCLLLISKSKVAIFSTQIMSKHS